MLIAYYTSYGSLGIVVGRKTYTYYGVESRDYRRVKKFVKLKLKGQLMQFLKQFSRKDIHNEED